MLEAIRRLLTPMPAISGFDKGWANTTVPVSSAERPPPSVPNLAIETARLQALVGISKRSVVTVILEDETAAGALGAAVIKGVVMLNRHRAAECLTGGS